ncbi:hydroxyisourate hydrolase [Williamsia phyllosphaerae]|uniref:5-hydroxyisourate hydrolase n=1 Tax=Williamsia phyllosphaerae TaxID=885042 RepID=A0ABQ1UAL5_9NOCA|nr:hydroxyisourate hydrolase [Williamsia phyllosphaerae]GGF13169.1 5-hydroxyisourate hydrolase [Williamsia phyllosphaerae]
MSHLSTHVLDAVRGTPAHGVAVVLADVDGMPIASGATDSDGRIADVAGDLGAGTYRIRFDTGAWFAENGVEGFYPEITICFAITDPTRHHHVPVLLSPFAYSTYRGS